MECAHRAASTVPTITGANVKSKAQTRAFDEKCLDLAKYFYPDATREQLDMLADDIQNVVEDASDDMSGGSITANDSSVQPTPEQS
jgi:hypothetical protein